MPLRCLLASVPTVSKNQSNLSFPSRFLRFVPIIQYQNETEQGRIQGALYSLQAIASAIGPIMMQFVDHIAQEAVDNPQTSWWYNFGPGTMFYFAAFIQVIAIGFAFALPIDKTDTRRHGGSGNGSRGAATVAASSDDNSGEEDDHDNGLSSTSAMLREPLLSGDASVGADSSDNDDSAAVISTSSNKSGPTLVRV